MTVAKQDYSDLPADLVRNFWRLTARSVDGCWVWNGGVTRPGYGSIYRSSSGGSLMAHRVSYLINVGPLRPDQQVLHHCDNTRCVRPDHLFLGNQSDNMQDCVRKGRCGMAKISPADAILIRRLYDERKSFGLTLQKIGQMFGISKMAVCLIGKRVRWGFVLDGDFAQTGS